MVSTRMGVMTITGGCYFGVNVNGKNWRLEMEQELAVKAEAAPDVPELIATGMLCAMDQTGDTRVQWDKNKAEEVVKARAKFDELIVNHTAYMLNANGQEEIITKFDPNVERIIMHKMMVGG